MYMKTARACTRVRPGSRRAPLSAHARQLPRHDVCVALRGLEARRRLHLREGRGVSD
jgi:hypothetical protein